MTKTIVILNARAGALLDRVVAEPHGIVKKTFAAAGREVDVQVCAPQELDSCIARAVRSDHGEIIVGGGDGTVSAAISHLAGTDKALGILPLGTLNLLARDFGMPTRLADAVSALATAERQSMDLGFVNGRWFHTVSGIGFFSQMARAREETRENRVPLFGRFAATALATWRALARMGRFRLTLDLDGVIRNVEAHSLLVTNNRFVGGPLWRRERLDGGHLEIHIGHDASALHRLLAGADMLSGNWRENPTIETFSVRSATIRARRSRLWVATDGETMRERLPLRYEIRPRALQVLIPAGAPEKLFPPGDETILERPSA